MRNLHVMSKREFLSRAYRDLSISKSTKKSHKTKEDIELDEFLSDLIGYSNENAKIDKETVAKKEKNESATDKPVEKVEFTYVITKEGFEQVKFAF